MPSSKERSRKGPNRPIKTSSHHRGSQKKYKWPINKHSTPLVTREMHIKATLRFLLIPVRTAVIKKTNKNAGKDASLGFLITLLVRMDINPATVETSVEVPQSTENGTFS